MNQDDFPPPAAFYDKIVVNDELIPDQNNSHQVLCIYTYSI